MILNSMDVARAKDYPYHIPRVSYLYADGTVQELTRPVIDGRIPVIAYGSNRAPHQLAAKFRAWPPGTTIPVSLGWLKGYDTVYSGHFTSYGALPAMLYPTPWAKVEVSVIWLTPAQLDRMHETEGTINYQFSRLDSLDLEVEGIGRLGHAFAYAGRRRPLRWQGRPIPLAAITAEGRVDMPLYEVDVLTLACRHLAPDAVLDAFIRQVIACPVTRAQRSERLQRGPLTWSE